MENENEVEQISDKTSAISVSLLKKIIFFLLLVCVSLFIIGCTYGERRMQNNAVKYGAGEYFVDNEGHTHFRFLTNQNEMIASSTLINMPVIKGK